MTSSKFLGAQHRVRPARVAEIVQILQTPLHPLSQLEQIHGITSAEAARRLGVSFRQYSRYKLPGASIPKPVKNLIQLGALSRTPPEEYSIDPRLDQWNRLVQST